MSTLRLGLLGFAAVHLGLALLMVVSAHSFYTAVGPFGGYNGHYIRDAVRDINWVLRDHHSDEVRPMNAGVLDLLGMLRNRLESHDPFLVISGYRSPTTNHRMYLRHDGVASNSYHIHGMAIDLRCEGRSLPQLRGAALSLRGGGVGYYPRSDFVHVDCGPVRHW